MSASAHSHRSVFKNIFSLISGRLFVSLSRLLIYLIIIRLTSAEIFGQYIVVMSIIYIGEWLMDFGFTDIAVRNISQDTKTRSKVLHAFSSIKIVQTLVAYCSAVAAIYLLGFTHLLPATFVGGVALAFFGVAQVYRVNFRLDMTMYKDMISESSGVLVSIILTLIFALNGASVMALVACHTASRIIYFLGNLYFGHGAHKFEFSFKDTTNIKTLVYHSAPLGLAGIMVSCYDSIIPLVLSKMLSMEAVAAYSVAIRLVYPIVLVTQAINNVFYTLLSNFWASDKNRFVATQQNMVEIICVVACGFFCLVYSGSDFIISIFGESMAESAAILRALSWGILARSMTIAMSSPIIICGGQRKTMWLTLIVVVFSTLLVIYMIPRYGIFGAVGSYLFVEIVITAIPVIFVSLYMADYRLQWLPIIKIYASVGIAVALVSLLTTNGTLLGALLSGLIYIALIYLTGAVSKEKIASIISIIRNRSVTATP